LRYAKQTKSKSYQASSFSAIGTAYSSVKKYKLANQYLDSALAANKGLNDNETYVSLLYDRLLNYDHQGDDAHADATWQRAMQAINEQGLAHWKHPFYDERHRFFEAQGDYKLALEAYKIFKALDDSIKGVELKESLAEMEVKYEVAEKDAQLALLGYEKEQAAAKNKLIYVSGGMAVVVLLLILLFTSRNNKLTKTLTQQKQKTLELEIVNKQQEERRLKSENEYQKKQLSTRALEVSQRNRVLIDVFEKLETLKQKESYGQQELITKLHAEVRSYLRSSEDWKRIRVHLEEVNSVLIQRIKAVHPQLTAKDVRLLMLFKIGLNTKEIANLLNLAPNSVKMSRYRLKKKLELDEEANLDAYLAKFEKDSTFSM
jgi:DNA-binding CsgD family transcriptional regulator